MSAALALRGIRKSYGSRVALAGLDLEAPAHAITGLIGPNGAGKTTCFGIAAGLLEPDAGQIDVLGRGPFRPAEQAGALGMLPQDAELPGHARVDALLAYFMRLQGATRGEASREVARVLELMSLGDRAGSRVRELSHGMRRRIAVAQALLGKPQLLLLDEPTSGLDPHLVASVRDVLRAERARGASLVVSSHVLADLEALCDHVVFVERGRTIKSGPLASVTGRSQHLRLTIAGALELPTLQAQLPDLELSLTGDRLEVFAPQSIEAFELHRRVLSSVLALGGSVLELRRGRSLEDAYLDERDKLERSPG